MTPFHLASANEEPPQDLGRAFAAHRAAIAEVLEHRFTQTNVPGRCAVLLPVLATLLQPLALLEVGASAGLCLLPDRYGYDDGPDARLPGSPVLHCAVSPGTPVPTRHPEIAWRARLDLHPLDASDADDRAWLEALVWPGRRRVAPSATLPDSDRRAGPDAAVS